MCCELPASFYQYHYGYGDRKETAWRHRFELEYTLRAARRERCREAFDELGYALKWFYETGARAVRSLGSIARPRRETGGEVPG